MKYIVSYSCISHIGKCRKINQDNFICNGIYQDENVTAIDFPLEGSLTVEKPVLIGLFDGMGGEECGEVASLLAAREASHFSVSHDPVNEMRSFCKKANDSICQYAEKNHIYSMGTTAALLAFTPKNIVLCNIGDSKIYRIADHKMEQVSVDHVGVAAYGRKPPLSQNLGIPEREMIIDPYVALGEYNDKDLYLICSDGLTDMVSEGDILGIIEGIPGKKAAERLLEQALANGGKDNITIILCQIERKRWFRKGR